jgi:tRNA(adenine34) deaminase
MKDLDSYMENKRRFRDHDYMQVVLEVATQAKLGGDLPIAAVLTWAGGRQLVEHDTRYSERNPLCYAVINLINKAYGTLGRKKLSEAVLYSNLEPNLFCALAIKTAGIKEVVFGAYDDKEGFISTNLLREDAQLDLVAIGGILGKECCESLPQSIQEYVRYE